MGKKLLEITGLNFGRLVVGRYLPYKKWECTCVCGNVIYSTTDALINKKTVSCGCARRDRLKANTKHGFAANIHKNEYRIWAGIKQRCFNKKSEAYKHYGAIGITMCEEWKNNFSAWLEYMGERPSMNHSVDRFPNRNGNYEPGNVRWATHLEQSYNRTNTKEFEVCGIVGTMQEWSKISGLTVAMMHHRIHNGWIPEDVILKPKREAGKYFAWKGEIRRFCDICKSEEVLYQVVDRRVKNGWSLEKAITTPTKKRR